MANRIYINVIGTGITFSAPCTEDIQVQAISQFTRIGELIPGIQQLTSIIGLAESATSGGVGRGIVNVQNALDVPIWQKTEPVKVTTDLNFFIKTSGYHDVWYPTMVLQSMNILSKKMGSSTLITPGFNVKSIGNLDQALAQNSANLGADLKRYGAADVANAKLSQNPPQASDFSSTSKLCSIYIPAIVYVPVAIIENIQITWSKQLSTSGYPIWSKVNAQFTGAFPAIFEDNFSNINPETMAQNYAILQQQLATANTINNAGIRT